MKEVEPDVLEMLIGHELVIKQLYEVFAATFKHRQEFWQNLARDEQGHADRLASLRSESTVNRWLLHESRLKPNAIKSSIGYVERQVARAREGNFSLLQALSIARDLEDALLEKHFSKLSDSTSERFRSILMDLAAETERHRKVLVEAIETEKRQSS